MLLLCVVEFSPKNLTHLSQITLAVATALLLYINLTIYSYTCMHALGIVNYTHMDTHILSHTYSFTEKMLSKGGTFLLQLLQANELNL